MPFHPGEKEGREEEEGRKEEKGSRTSPPAEEAVGVGWHSSALSRRAPSNDGW